MIQSIISWEMLTTVVEHRPVVPCDGERVQKEGFQVMREKHDFFVIWTVGCKEKENPFSYFSSSWMGCIIKKNTGDQIYSMC